MLDGIGTGDRVDGVGDAGFLRNDLLGPQGDEGGLFGWQGQRFVQRVCMQRLATPENGGEGLHRDANDIVFGLLGGERRPGGLRVEAQEQRARVFCVEAVAHDFGPQAARRAVLGNFFKKIIVGVEEKRELRREFVEDRKSTRLNSSHGYISYAVFCLKKKNKSSFVSLSAKSSRSFRDIAWFYAGISVQPIVSIGPASTPLVNYTFHTARRRRSPTIL